MGISSEHLSVHSCSPSVFHHACCATRHWTPIRYEPDTPANEVNHPAKPQHQFHQNPKTISPESQDGFCQITQAISPKSKNIFCQKPKHILPKPANNYNNTLAQFCQKSKTFLLKSKTNFAKTQHMFTELQNHCCQNRTTMFQIGTGKQHPETQFNQHCLFACVLVCLV